MCMHVCMRVHACVHVYVINICFSLSHKVKKEKDNKSAYMHAHKHALHPFNKHPFNKTSIIPIMHGKAHECVCACMNVCECTCVQTKYNYMARPHKR